MSEADVTDKKTQAAQTRPLVMWLFVGILVFGALLRLPGHFYPLTLHYDEGAGVEASMCRFPPGGTYAHPVLNRYLLTLAQAPICAITWVRGGGLEDILAAWESDQAPFLYLTRTVAFLCGLGTIILAFLLGRGLGGAALGLTAALFVAVSPMHVHVTNVLQQWSLATMLTIAVLYASLGVATTTASRRRLVIFGILAGLATTTVYPLVLIGVPVFITLLGRWRAQRAAHESVDWKMDLALVAAGAIVAHLLGNFSTIVAPERFVHAWRESKVFALAMSSTIDYTTNLKWYFQSLVNPQGLGPLIAITGFAGLLLAARRGGTTWLAMLALVATLLFVMPALQPLMSNRYTAPAGTVVIIGSAWLVVSIAQWLARAIAPLARYRPAFILPVLAALPCLLTTLVYERALRLPPTRELARAWIETNVQSGTQVLQNVKYISPVLIDCSHRPLLRDKAACRTALLRGRVHTGNVRAAPVTRRKTDAGECCGE